eukprot:1401833-Pyramimonas_sp.AAC.2
MSTTVQSAPYVYALTRLKPVRTIRSLVSLVRLGKSYISTPGTTECARVVPLVRDSDQFSLVKRSQCIEADVKHGGHPLAASTQHASFQAVQTPPTGRFPVHRKRCVC